jgi:hypothetical protein
MRHAALFAAVLGTVLVGTAGTALADDKPAETAPASATPPTPSTPAPAAEKPKKEEDEEELKHLTLTANPLSLILGRIGINVEYLPIKHHAIVLNPYFQSISAGTDQDKTTYTNFGGELGYHFYTGERGANGFFVGPSLLYMRANASSTSNVAGVSSSASSNMDVYGAALDIGGQHITKGGFTIGGGAGVMYLTASSSSTATSSTFKVSGVLPRFLLTIGYSF